MNFSFKYFSGEHIWSSICNDKSQNFIFNMGIEQQHEDLNFK